MQIIIYSTTTCPYCKMLKDYLAAKSLAFTEKLVDTDEAAKQEMMASSNGFLGVPFTVIMMDNGRKETVLGFDKGKLDTTFGLKEMIFVNYKTYEEGSGPRALSLTKILEEVAHETQVKIIPVVQIIDAEAVMGATTLQVWIQHVDPVSYGAHTGWTLPEEAARIGISGVFLNHSEHKFDNFENLKAANEKAMAQTLKL